MIGCRHQNTIYEYIRGFGRCSFVMFICISIFVAVVVAFLPMGLPVLFSESLFTSLIFTTRKGYNVHLQRVTGRPASRGSATCEPYRSRRP